MSGWLRPVQREFRDEGLYVASFRGHGEVSISRQKLKEPQFRKAMGLLWPLQENGKKQQ
jgi:hypothetical protein